VALIAIVAVGAAAMMFKDFGRGESRPARQDTEEHIVVQVEVYPWPRPIDILVTVEGVPTVHEGTILPHTPWAHDFWIPRGATVGVHVWQRDAGTSACSISSNGIVVDSRATMDSPASVCCHHNRKGG
jgi:hypothetical protein